MVDFVLKHNARNLITDEIGRLNGVGGGVEEVVLERACRDGQLEVATSFQIGVTGGGTPHLERVGRHGVFGGGFLVFAVGIVCDTVGPGVAMVPVEVTVDGKVLFAQIMSAFCESELMVGGNLRCLL